MFNQALFLEVGTRFFAKFATSLKLLLRPEKTFPCNHALFIEYYFLFSVPPRCLRPTSGLELQAKSSVPIIKTFGLDPIIFLPLNHLKSMKSWWKYYLRKISRELFFVTYKDFSLLTKNTARYILVGKCVAQLFESLFFGLFEGSFFIRKRK